MKQLYSLLLFIVVCITSCSGQDRTHLREDTVGTPQVLSTGQPKITKDQRWQHSTVHCGLQDQAGNLWFGTTGLGVYRYDGKSFTNFTVEDGLNNNVVWSVCEDNTGNIWFGTADGICRYDGKTFTRIPVSVTVRSNFASYNSPRLQNKLTTDVYGNPSEENAVWSIVQDRTGRFWFGTTDGIYCYDGKTFTHFLQDGKVVNTSGLHITKVERILEDKAGNIWFGGRRTEGLLRFDGTSVTGFTPDGKNWLWPLLEDKTGNLWFARRKHSLYRYDGKTFTTVASQELPGWIFSMAEDETGNLWLPTERGVARFDGTDLAIFTMTDEPIHSDVFSVTIDKSGNLWIGARGTGLFRYDGKSFTNFTEELQKSADNSESVRPDID